MEDLDNNKSIPLLRGPANMMMLGPNGANFANAAVRIHPVDRMQRGIGNPVVYSNRAVYFLLGSFLSRFFSKKILAFSLLLLLFVFHTQKSVIVVVLWI